MARCYICDSYITRPVIDHKTGKLRHCESCDSSIKETLDDFDDKGSALTEEELALAVEIFV